MTTLADYIKDILATPSVAIFAIMSIVEIVPIKISPWSSLLKWIGGILNHDIREELSELKCDFENKKAEDMRWEILNFANSCRRNVRHSSDEWRHAITQIAKYEEYTEAKSIVNGVIEEDSRFLREKYKQHNILNDFL